MSARAAKRCSDRRPAIAVSFAHTGRSPVRPCRSNAAADVVRESARGVIRYLDRIDVGGSLFAALCCLGFPALVSLLSAIGLGFLVNDAILILLLIVFLGVAIAGLYSGVRHHHRWAALIMDAASAVITAVFIAIVPHGVLAGIGIAGLICASLLNVWLQKSAARRPIG